jgi:SAM-dependent methyltransferase
MAPDPSAKPLINWDVIQELVHGRFGPPPRPQGAGPHGGPPHAMPGRGIGGWDNSAEFYYRMVRMEEPYTLKQLELIETAPTDTVLDVCGGCGRVAVPLARRVASVTLLDASPKMLELAHEYASEEGVEDKIQPLLFDWDDRAAAERLPQHDIVVTSRNQSIGDLDRLARLARKWVVLIIWANGAPSIPQIVGRLFEGAQEEGADRRPPGPHMDRRLGNNLFYNRAYDLGFEPNVRIVDDGYTKTFPDRESAYDFLSGLGMFAVAPGKEDVFRRNCDQFLTDQPGGAVTFFSPTASMVLWFQVNH